MREGKTRILKSPSYLTLKSKTHSIPEERHRLGRLRLEGEHLIGCYHLTLVVTGSSRFSDVASSIVLKPEISNKEKSAHSQIYA